METKYERPLSSGSIVIYEGEAWTVRKYIGTGCYILSTLNDEGDEITTIAYEMKINA